MRTFDSIGIGICEICGESKEGKVTLVPITGTDDDGNSEAVPVHVDCIDLRFNRDTGVFYQHK